MRALELFYQDMSEWIEFLLTSSFFSTFILALIWKNDLMTSSWRLKIRYLPNSQIYFLSLISGFCASLKSFGLSKQKLFRKRYMCLNNRNSENCDWLLRQTAHNFIPRNDQGFRFSQNAQNRWKLKVRKKLAPKKVIFRGRIEYPLPAPHPAPGIGLKKKFGSYVKC